MSRKNYNEPYEDELDRMRARRKRAVSPRQRQRFDDDWDDDFDEVDFHENDDWKEDGYFENNDWEEDDYFDDDDWEDEPDVRPRNLRRTGYGRNGSTDSAYGRDSVHGRRHQIAEHSGYSNHRQGNSTYGSRTQGRKKNGRRKKKAPLILAVVLVLLLLSGGMLYAKRWAKDRDGYWNIAVFGVDSRDGGLEKGALADVQMIASINKKTGEIRLVSVYRDTYVQINDDGDFHKINEAYFKGGHKQALETLKRNLDVDVDDYATFNWKAVADGINILGGIDLEITESEFAYINSFITATVESTGIASFHLEHPGMNHLDGVQAVAYSRLRLMDTDFNRTERQRKVVALALEKAKQADFKTLTGLAGVILSEISTSIGPEDVIPLARDAGHYFLGQTGGFPFAKTTADVGKLDCVIPMTLESNVVFLHQFLFDQEGYQPSESVKKISKIISERTGIYEEGKSAGADTNLGGVTGNTGAPASPSPGGASNQGGSSQGGASLENSGNNDKADTLQTEEAISEENAGEETKKDTEEESREADEEEKENKDESKADKESTKAEDKGENDKEEKTTAAEKESNPTPVEPLAPEETTLSQEQIMEGPGAVHPPKEPGEGANPPAPEPPTAEAGPGFEGPGGN